MESYAIYLRKSRADSEAEERGEGETLSRHKKMLLDIAKSRSYNITDIYEEIVSGDTIASRPEMQRLLEAVQSGLYTGVLAMDIDRLSRGSTIDQGIIAQVFKFSDTKIVTPNKTYDPTNDTDEEMFEFFLFMSRREYKTINRRIQAGRMQSVREGKYICSRPAYGYRKVKLAGEKGFTLEICPEEAEIVRQIFDWYVNGLDGNEAGVVKIAGRLHDLRIPFGQQGTTWKPARVYRILTNEIYIGKIRWGRVRTHRRLTENGIEKRLVTMNDYQLYDGRHEAIIGEDVFARAQEILKNRDIVPVRKLHPLSNPLSGLVFCEKCGHAMRGLPACGRQPACIFCATRGCPTVRTYRKPVEDSILNTLREWLSDYRENITINAAAKQPIIPQDGLLEHLLSEKKQLVGQKSKLHDFLERDVYTVEMFVERLSELTKRLREIDKSIADERKRRKPVLNSPEELIPLIQHVLDTYDVAETAADKNKLLKSVISRIMYSKSIRGIPGVPSDQFTIEVYPKITQP